jgi:hypothetical protein
MGVLEDYEKRCGKKPLRVDTIVMVVRVAEMYLERADPVDDCDRTRVLVWLAERVQTMAAVLGDPSGTMACGWCWRAAGLTQEIWRGLPKFTLADAQAHALACDHNPLVVRVRQLEAKVAELEHDVDVASIGGTT